MHILLAEDDVKLGPLVVHMLNKEGHTTDWVKDGIEAIDYIKSIHYDLIIVDWMMPRMDGTAVCRYLRTEAFNGGIIMLTAKDTIDDRVNGLDAGADDYIIKPFEFAELFARIRSLSRRVAQPVQDEWIEVHSYRLMLNEKTLVYDTKSIVLTIREFQLMELMMRNYGKILSRQLLIDRIWGFDADVNSNSLDALVKQLRKKLDCTLGPITLINVRGTGYTLEVPDVC